MKTCILCLVFLAFTGLISAQIQPGKYTGKTKAGPVSLTLTKDSLFDYNAEKGALQVEQRGSWFVRQDTLATFFPGYCDQPGASEDTYLLDGIQVKVLDVNQIRKVTFAQNVAVTVYSGKTEETQVAHNSDHVLNFNLPTPVDSIIFRSRYCRKRIIFEPSESTSNYFEAVLNCYRYEFILNHTFVSYQLWKIKGKKLINLKTGEKLAYKGR